jgi:UDP-glucose 4-epimerase
VKVVVTGGAGFIGANLCARLSADPVVTEVVVLDDLSSGYRDNLEGLDVVFVEGSILDRELLDDATADADAIVHLAAIPGVPPSIEDPATSHLVNATGTVEVLEAARRAGNAHVVVASSAAVYGVTDVVPTHEHLPVAPVSPYGASKVATENYALCYQRTYGLPVLALRFFNIYGPLQKVGHAYAAVVPAFVDAALSGLPIPLEGDGRQTRDFAYVGDVAEVITEAIARRVTHDAPVNLAVGVRNNLLELIETLRGIVGADLPVENLPPRRGDIRDSQADVSTLRRLFPDVEAVPLADGLAQTVAWYRTILTADDGR